MSFACSAACAEILNDCERLLGQHRAALALIADALLLRLAAGELEKAEETAKILRQKNETVRAKLKTMYTENSEKWVSEIFSQIIE